ncbi:MAG: DUF2306 domain-containing protein [Pseudomonadota bacterium]
MDRRYELIAEMTPAIWIHLLAVLLAVVIGGWVLWRRKGDARHRLLGRSWVALMGVGALSSFWVREINAGGFSPIHALAAWTLFSLVAGVVAIRMRDRLPNAVRIHRGFLQSLYATGILIAGGFTFLPERLLGRLTFGETFPWINLVFVAVVAVGGVWMLVRTFSRREVDFRGVGER